MIAAVVDNGTGPYLFAAVPTLAGLAAIAFHYAWERIR